MPLHSVTSFLCFDGLDRAGADPTVFGWEASDRMEKICGDEFGWVESCAAEWDSAALIQPGPAAPRKTIARAPDARSGRGDWREWCGLVG